MQSSRPWLIFVVLSIGIALRLLYLDADPYYYEWVGYIIDEGRWVQHARSLALHQTMLGGHAHNLHLFLAPLFQFVHYLIFSLAGVSIWTSRVFTALCGSALLILFWWGLRQLATPHALLLGVTLLASQADLVELSRVAIPEMALMFFQLLIYFLLVQPTSSPYRMVAAGLLLLIAVGLKVTVAPMVVIFSVLLFFMPRPPGPPETSTVGEQRRSDLWRFWCGFAAPVLVVGLVVLSYLVTKMTFTFPSLWSLVSFLRLSGAYNKAAFLFEDTLSPTLNFWALGLWLSVLAWTAERQRDIDLLARRYLVTSAIWFILYFFLMLFPEYFPTRYKVHILLPMAVNITVGLSLFQRIGIQKVINSFAESTGMLGLFRLWLLGLPTAAFFAPVLASFIGLIGVEVGRLRFKLACFVVVMITIVYIVHRLRRQPHAVGFFLSFPLLGGLAWLRWSTSGMYSSFFWPHPEIAVFNVGWALFVLLVSVAAVVLARSAADWRDVGSVRLMTAYAACYLIVSLINLAPGYIDPHYSIPAASHDLTAVLADSSSIAVSRAEGLFNNNTLRYKSLGERNSAVMPEFVVVGFVFRGKKEWLEQHYQIVKTYNLYVSPEYSRLQADDPTHPLQGENVTVYKRKNETDGGG